LEGERLRGIFNGKEWERDNAKSEDLEAKEDEN
jgi:hypothetical protein